MNADENTGYIIIRELGKNCLLKSYVCCHFLNHSNICIHCKIAGKKVTLYVKAVRTINRYSYTLHCREKGGQLPIFQELNSMKDN